MKIEVAKRDLESALAVVQIGTAGKGNDIQAHYVFRVSNSKVSIYSYNGRIGTSIPLVAEVQADEGEAFTVESWRLAQWLRASGDIVVSLESKDATVTATSPKGSVKFRSLDPSSFPFWDKTLESAKETLTVEASRLGAAMAHVRGFISKGETTQPEMAVTEARDGALWATDQGALTVVYLSELGGSHLRVHGKDIPSVRAFLATANDDAVTVFEHKRSTFFQRSDGGLLSVSLPTVPFVELDEIEMNDPDKFWWSVGVDDLKNAIQQLSAGAAKEDTRLNLNFDAGTQEVLLSMTADSGATNVLRLTCPEHGQEEGVGDFPREGWSVDYSYLNKILATYKGGNTLRFGLFPAGDDGGWARLKENRDGDLYATILVWLP